jgi:hypothetical protein
MPPALRRSWPGQERRCWMPPDSFTDHLRRTEGGKPLGEAVADFLQAKKAERLSDRHLASLRHHLGPLHGGDAGPATTANVDHGGYRPLPDQTRFVTGTANTFRRDIRTFFEWASARGLSPGNPAAKATIVQESTGKDWHPDTRLRRHPLAGLPSFHPAGCGDRNVLRTEAS